MIRQENLINTENAQTALFEGICPECKGFCVYGDCEIEIGFVSFLLFFNCLDCGYKFKVNFANGIITAGGEQQC